MSDARAVVAVKTMEMEEQLAQESKGKFTVV